MSDKDSTPSPPLDSNRFHMLAALASRPSHGYAVRQEVEERTDGRVRLWPATLYGGLASLAGDGLIVEVESPTGAADDPRRRYYAITEAGRRALRAEAARLEGLARWAQAQLALGEAAR